VREYELIYILNPDLTDEREAEIHQRLDDLILKHEGIILLRDDWGKRKLAYEIQKLQKGHYFLLSYLDSGQVNLELERELRLNADAIRFLTVLVDEKVKDPAERITESQAKAAEQAKRREQREREAAERERRAAEAAASGERPQSSRGRSDDDDDDEEED